MAHVQGVAEVLGVRRPKTEVELVATIEHGLPLKSLVRVSGLLAPSDGNFKYWIVPKASLARRKGADRLSPAESALVARLAGVWAHAVEIWRDEADARDFLNRPHQLLKGKRPIDVARANEYGAKLVEDILGRIEAGVAV